ncbi:MAG: TolC family protein [Chloroherpetonaceae bacterium]|nr:TolC family protein [Chloroherpetonaceae bacterium]
MKHYLVFFLGLLLRSASMLGQPIEELIEQSFSKNLKLKSFQYLIRSAKHKEYSVSALPAPRISFELQQIPLSNLSVNLLNDPLSQNLSFSQEFPWFGKLNALKNLEERKSLLIKSDSALYWSSLKFELIKRYFLLWKYRQSLALKDSIIVTYEKAIDAARVSFKSSTQPLSESLKLQSELALAKFERSTLKNEYRSILVSLNFLLNSPSDTFSINPTYPQNFDYDSERFEDHYSLSQNPVIKKMSVMIDMQNAEMAVAETELLPDIMLQSMLMRMPNGMILTSNSMSNVNKGGVDYMYGVMASFTLPFLPWSIDGPVQKAESFSLTAKAIELERESMLKELYSELKMLNRSFNLLKQKIRLIQLELLPLLRMNLDLQWSEFLLSKSTISSFLDSSRMYFMKKQELYETEYELALLYYSIQITLGR